jgi:hypothetical protein
MAAPSTYKVERRQHIAAPPEAVRERIVDFHRWEAWSPWHDLDPDMRQTYTGPESGVGAGYAWEGNRRAGKGSMEIVGADESRVTIDLRFLKPFKARNTTEFLLEPEGGGTLVTWTMTGPKTFVTKVMGIFKSMDKMIGPDFEKGLARLQADVGSGGGETAPAP